jgi:hypothetical protein
MSVVTEIAMMAFALKSAPSLTWKSNESGPV